jgi:homocysteine S-methyltransferase
MGASLVADLLPLEDVVFLDGALATELQARGCNIDGPLWSGRALAENPDLIRQVHLDYFRAGAEVAITASYQASLRGLEEQGYAHDVAFQLIRRSAELAIDARREYLEEQRESDHGTCRPLLVAGSVGPYGAYLNDGSEYRGDYSLSLDGFISFHRPRIRTLRDAGVDLLAVETIPSQPETQALLKLLSEEFSDLPAWFSFTTRDHAHISDGTPVEEVMRSLRQSKQVVAVGINCIAMEDVSGALAEMVKHSSLPLIVYPNSGQVFDVATNSWSGARTSRQKLAALALEWRSLGARFIGGCCQTGPEDIKAIVSAFGPTQG